MIVIAATNPISANTIEFRINTLRNINAVDGSNNGLNVAPNINANTMINVDEINERSTAAAIFPITNADGAIGAKIYSSRLLW